MVRVFNAKVKSVHNRTLDGLGDVPSAVDITVGISEAILCPQLGNINDFDLIGRGKIVNLNRKNRTYRSFGFIIIKRVGIQLNVRIAIVIDLGLITRSNVDLEMVFVDLQRNLGVNIKVAGKSITSIGGALQRGITDSDGSGWNSRSGSRRLPRQRRPVRYIS